MFTPRPRRLSACVLALLGFMVCAAPLTKGNDIEKFIKQLRGNSGVRPNAAIQPVGHRYEGDGHRHSYDAVPRGGHNYGWPNQLSSRDVYKIRQSADARFAGDPVFSLPDYHHHVGNGYPRTGYPRSGFAGSRSGIQLNFTLGTPAVAIGRLPAQTCQTTGGPQLPVPPVPVVPVLPSYPPVLVQPPHPDLLVMPHQIGEIVDCQVPLAPCVEIEDPQNIAPNAVPVVVAVRDPNLPPWHKGCVDALVYVEVCVPPCPLQKLTISPCKTRIRMDFGKYEVDIKSTKGVIVIDYDD